jgi:hypothetical protein
MAEASRSPSSLPQPTLSVGGSPMTSVYSFSAPESISALVRLPDSYRALGASWHFRLLHITGLLFALPIVALSRLSPGRRREHRDESVLVETNRSVLTALGFAFMA